MQSYAAYTPVLDRLNADRLASRTGRNGSCDP